MLVAASLMLATAAQAQTIIEGAPRDVPPPLTVIGDLIVGNTGTGTLNVNSGGSVSAPADVLIGNVGTATGTLKRQLRRHGHHRRQSCAWRRGSGHDRDRKGHRSRR
jgi:hypothetical protein